VPVKPIGYLIGSIRHAKDPIKAFDAAQRAVEEVGHTALNPVKEEADKTGMALKESLEKLDYLWKQNKLDEFKQLFECIYERDLDNVRKADYLVLHFEEDDTTIGTTIEMTLASICYLLKVVQKVVPDKEKSYGDTAIYSLKQMGYKPKPIYWVCQGSVMPINDTLKWLVLASSEIKFFKTYKDLSEHLGKTYGTFPQIIKNEDAKKQEKEEEKK